MASNTVETLVGGIVVAAAGGFLVYAANATDVTVGSGDYELIAKFRKAEGLVVGADVRLAGVKIGTVRDLRLDTKTYRAVAVFAIGDDYPIPDDSNAKIATEGLLGGGYVAIDPGGSQYMLAPGDEIEYTQGSVNLLDLVGKAMSGRTPGE